MGPVDRDVGRDASDRDGFYDAEGRRLAGDGRGVLVRQQSPTTFSLEEPFSYRSSRGEWAVSPDRLTDTDLASVPWPMRWFLPRYGRHTLAALLHDELVSADSGNCTSRRVADRLFFESLRPLGVPVLLRLIMWIAVTVETRWSTPDRWRMARRIGLVAWFTAALWGISNFLVHAAWWDAGPLGQRIVDLPPFGWSGISLSLVLPVLAAPLWGNDTFPQGVAAIIPGFFVVPMSFLTAVAYGIYWVTEMVFGFLWALVFERVNPDVDIPQKMPLGPEETLG